MTIEDAVAYHELLQEGRRKDAQAIRKANKGAK
jgi:hypothetical protein